MPIVVVVSVTLLRAVAGFLGAYGEVHGYALGADGGRQTRRVRWAAGRLKAMHGQHAADQGESEQERAEAAGLPQDRPVPYGGVRLPRAGGIHACPARAIREHALHASLLPLPQVSTPRSGRRLGLVKRGIQTCCSQAVERSTSSNSPRSCCAEHGLTCSNPPGGGGERFSRMSHPRETTATIVLSTVASAALVRFVETFLGERPPQSAAQDAIVGAPTGQVARCVLSSLVCGAGDSPSREGVHGVEGTHGARCAARPSRAPRCRGAGLYRRPAAPFGLMAHQ
jgi:hypothetical protein